MARVCAALCPGDVEAQREMMQACSVQLYEVLREKGGAMTGRYLRGVWQHKCKDHYSASKRRSLRLVSLDGVELAAPQSDGRYAQLLELMEGLSEGEREVMSLYTQCDTMAELGRELGLSEVNARVRVHRIAKKMRQWITDKKH